MFRALLLAGVALLACNVTQAQACGRARCCPVYYSCCVSPCVEYAPCCNSAPVVTTPTNVVVTGTPTYVNYYVPTNYYWGCNSCCYSYYYPCCNGYVSYGRCGRRWR